DLMIASDVVCLSSAAEASPISLIEAMSLGRPVIAPQTGGIPEVVIDAETGILVPSEGTDGPDPEQFATALETLAADRARAEAFGAEGRGRYERFSTAHTMLDAYENVFRQLARPAAAPAAGS